MYIELIILCLLLGFLYNCIVIIPARRCVIVERLGQYNRILKPGIHFVLFPAEKLKVVRWTYKSQSDKLTVLNTHLLSFENNQMDIPPISCISLDQIQLSVDVTLMYTITNPSIAVYETDDVLNFFYQTVQQAVRSNCNAYKASDLSLSKFSNIIEPIIDQINREVDKRGIKCNRLILQNIIINPEIVKSFENIFVSKKQAEMLEEQEKADHDRRMKSLEFKKKEVICQNELAIMAAKSEAEAFKIKGFTADHLVKMKEIEALQNVQKVVYLPSSIGNIQIKN